MPAHSSPVLRWPQNRPNSKVKSGTEATASAATPEATPACSASVTPPLPQASNRKPIMPAAFHCFQLGIGAPRKRMKANRMEPAMVKRTPAIINGGQVSMPMRMAR
jgi:hypothetical protein